ncbi:MAG: glycosyltransferase family 4 protein [Planctomycetes bacterium]|nr:glycosyltransferase family 4 protein [Planctomycetota bacterium]
MRPRVLVLNQFYWPDVAATAQILTDLAEDLAEAGWDVTAVAGRAPYEGAAPPLVAAEERRGVRIRRVWATAFGRGEPAGRLCDYATFFAGAAGACLTLPRPDVIVTLSTPPLLSLVGLATRLFRGSRFVYWVQDLYPDTAVALGLLGAGWKSGALEALSRASLRGADRVVALGEGMRARVLGKGVEAGRARVIPNWSDGAQVAPVAPERNAFRRAHGLGGRFVVLYSGNLGRAHEFDTLLGAAGRLGSAAPDVCFLFVGGGPARKGVEREAAARGLSNVGFLPYQPREALAESLGSGDVLVVSLRPELEGCMVPSKVYGAMAAGRPVLYVGDPRGEVARLVRDAGCGMAVEPGDADGLADAVLRLRAGREEAEEMGRRGREWYLRRLDRPVATRAWEELLRVLLAGRGAGNPARPRAEAGAGSGACKAIDFG